MTKRTNLMPREESDALDRDIERGRIDDAERERKSRDLARETRTQFLSDPKIRARADARNTDTTRPRHTDDAKYDLPRIVQTYVTAYRRTVVSLCSRHVLPYDAYEPLGQIERGDHRGQCTLCLHHAAEIRGESWGPETHHHILDGWDPIDKK